MSKNITRRIILPVALFLAVTAGYIFFVNHYFLPYTSIDQIDVSGLTFEEARTVVEKKLHGSEAVTISARDNEKVEIMKEDINWNIFADIEKATISNKSLQALMRLFQKKNYSSDIQVTFDERLLEKNIMELPMFQKERMRPAQNADIVFLNEYQIIAGDLGTELSVEPAVELIKNKIFNRQDYITLGDDCYRAAEVGIDDMELNNRLQKLKTLEKSCIIYENLPGDIEVNVALFHEWIDKDTLEIDKGKVLEWVTQMAKETDTAYTTRTFLVNGEEIKETGPYGYRIDKEKETNQIIADIQSGEIIIRSPIYAQEASSRYNELGGTFVEVDLTNQLVRLYTNGKLSKESSCVTGCVAQGNATPSGIYPLTYKQRNAVLRGPGYASPVSYWMPFNRGIGLHDANWRKTFGGNIYKSNGSHGCINLPTDMAKAIYEVAYAGMAVICHE